MKIQVDRCPSCESYIAPDQSHCSCGRPTSFATFEERASYEVAQWRAHQERAAANS